MHPTELSGESGGGARGGAAQPLVVLGGAGLGEVIPCNGADAVHGWLVAGDSVLWLRGPAGSGKSTAVGASVRKVFSERPQLFRGALRVECAPGMRFEETLFELNQFLRQLGIFELDTVLNQRTSLSSKVAILLETLARHPVLIWLDDFEWLSAAPGSDRGQSLRFFAHGWPALRGASGRLLIVTENAGPEGLTAEDSDAQILQMDRTAAVNPDTFRSRLRQALVLPQGIGDEPFAPEVENGALWPLAIRIRQVSLAAVDDQHRTELAERTRSADPARVVTEVLPLLPGPARRVLEAAVAFRAPLGRGALRALTGEEPGSGGPELFRQVERLGLAQVTEENGWAVRIHPLVRLAVQENAERMDPDGWKALQKKVALYLIEAGNRTDDLPYYLRARESLFSSGHFAEAYEVQKLFLEDLLRRGFYELTRKILTEAASTTSGAPRAVSLGNLAIIHKNEGNLEEAIRLYEQVRKEFEMVGDLPNTARVYHQLGNTHYLRGDHQRAIENYQKSLDISLDINERSVAAATKIQIANVQYISGNHLEALEAYRETLALAEELDDRNITAAIHLQIGQLLITLRRLSEAEEELNAAEREAGELGDRRNLIKVGQLLGLVAGERRDYDQAVMHLEKAADIACSLGDPLEMAACFLRIGVFETARVHFPKAVAALLHALDLLDTNSDRVKAAVGPTDLTAYRTTVEKHLDDLARQVGPEVFGRMLRTLGKSYPFPAGEAPPATAGP